MSRKLNKAVLAGGVIYPAGSSGEDVEAAVTNPAHWDDSESVGTLEVGVKVLDEDRALELITLAKTTHEQLESVLTVIAPLVDVEVDEDADEGALELALYEAVILDEGGLERLAEKVAELTTEAPEDDGTTTVEPIDYSSKRKGELEGLVAERNDGREDDQKVVVGGKGEVKDLIAALKADDEKQSQD